MNHRFCIDTCALQISYGSVGPTGINVTVPVSFAEKNNLFPTSAQVSRRG